MPGRPDIRPQMQVLTSDNAFYGTVDGFEGDDIRVNLARAGEGHQTIPVSWVDRVDNHVHLNRAGAEIEVGLRAAQFTPADKAKPAAAAQAPATPAKPGGGKQIWIWLAIAVVVVLLLTMLF
jgi:hypothetical protein